MGPDHHTKYSWLYPLHNKTAEEVLEKLESLFWVFGFPQTLHTDNGKEFKNKKMQYFCQKHGIKQVHGEPRTPQTQGLVERNNRTVKENLSNILKEIQADHSSWCSKLGEAAYKKISPSTELSEKHPTLTLDLNIIPFDTPKEPLP